MELERDYFQTMYDFLKKDLGVKPLIAGTSDHNHGRSGYPLLTSTSLMDLADGHVYWQHPSYGTDPKTKRRTFSIKNTPMVNDPFNSTVVQLSRSAVAGKPYTVSETNHPFPSEYACEGIGILAAYSAFHDWDGIYLYTFEHKIAGHFDIRPDPVRMCNIAACAAMFLRGDVRPAIETVWRSYSAEQVREGIRLPYSERTYFTPGFSLAIPLRHATRIGGFNEPYGQNATAGRSSPTVSDTGELAWYHPEKGKGFVTVETDRSQALIGFLKGCDNQLKNLSATVKNEFCSIILASLDNQPISSSPRLLLVTTAKSANSGMIWNEKRTTLSDWGSAPTVIEPVKGEIVLRNMEPAQRIEAVALDGGGKPLGGSVSSRAVKGDFTLSVGDKATTWYLIRIQR
jgi:cold shock CspA family protein